MSEVKLTANEVEEILSPKTVRSKAREVFELCRKGETAFQYNEDKLSDTTGYVLKVIEKNYPSLNIPFHSRWGHFKAGGIDRVLELDRKMQSLDALEKARIKIDLVVTSVLLDAGAGMKWGFIEESSGQRYSRSEGLGVASFHMFLSGAMSSDGTSLRADRDGLKAISSQDVAKAFQVSEENPLIGVEGRTNLLNSLAKALENGALFPGGRPGHVIDSLMVQHGRKIPATAILRAVLDGLGPIWPKRLMAGERNLGDVWRHSKVGLVPFHKLSQWMTYSLIEPMLEAGLEVSGVEDLTGLAEYRNGGLMIDSGLISPRDQNDYERVWRPDSDFIIEWRALTVHLLDEIGAGVRKALGKTAAEFPLAKILEGGTWWAGRFLASEKRADGGSPIKIESDGTVF